MLTPTIGPSTGPGPLHEHRLKAPRTLTYDPIVATVGVQLWCPAD